MPSCNPYPDHFRSSAIPWADMGHGGASEKQKYSLTEHPRDTRCKDPCINTFAPDSSHHITTIPSSVVGMIPVGNNSYGRSSTGGSTQNSHIAPSGQFRASRSSEGWIAPQRLLFLRPRHAPHRAMNLHSIVNSNASLAIRTGNQHLVDFPLNPFPEILAEMKMNDTQKKELNSWMDGNNRYLPAQVYQAGFFNSTGGGRELDEKHKEVKYQEIIKLKRPLRNIFHRQTEQIQQETVIWCVQQGRDSLLPLVEAVGTVLDEKDMIESMRAQRGGKWPTAEEIGELVVVRKIVKEIEGKIVKMKFLKAWVGRKGSSAGADAAAAAELDNDIKTMEELKAGFVAREERISRGEWMISGYKQEGEWQENGPWSRPGLTVRCSA
ncbi:hypothetical protein QBC37DRAFT_405641 [Rhypophila decipiens]|uniref:Uncharacterized protein n=1 Tax=Rhypophila decipiens TaxID=261697 RepID=A0AAN6XYS1_9PEZI|nr:hypothetical protein QBC37DRAFT_405641 [Rhypophila decipiens]